MGLIGPRVGTDVENAETHVNAFKKDALDAVTKAYAAIGELETKLNALIAKYEK